MKVNSKPWFLNQIVSAMQRRDKLYKKFKHSGLETDKDNFKVAKMYLQKIILKKKNMDKPKELWKALKSLGLSSDKTRKMVLFNLKHLKAQILSKSSTVN